METPSSITPKVLDPTRDGSSGDLEAAKKPEGNANGDSILHNCTPPPLKRRRTSSQALPAITNTNAQQQQHHAEPMRIDEEVPKWQRVTEDVFSAVVSIRFSQPMSFDTEPALSSEATGFIVDAQRGIILTNRHVVGAGPFVGEAIMYDHEEVEVKAIYRDPIHDFGLLQFDPAQVKYMKLREIPLSPERARVGIDIRVIGNDAGEKLSILAGSISRVDRNTPEYGELTYNDFNTFYLQAASSLSGGSSGSPVIDVHGHAVALQAGGRCEEATNFFLPLDRVKRALELVQQGQHVVRGTMQTRFLYNPFDEVRRLGMSRETEAMVRRERPDGIGMLAVATVLPEGPGKIAGLEEGDVLVSINGDIVTHFVDLERLMDDNVGKQLRLVVDRGGVAKEIVVEVQDLHAITPSRFVTVDGSIVNNLSYQLACNYNVPVRGVYLSSPGNLFSISDSDEGNILASIDNRPIKNIDEFIEVVKSIPDREFVPVSFYSIEDVHTMHGALIQMSHHWGSMRLYTRNDKTGQWDYTSFKDFPKPTPIEPVSVCYPVLENDNAGKAAILANSMVRVYYHMPVRMDGSRARRCRSYGVVVDAERGLVVVSRRTVPINLGDMYISIAESAIIPAKVRFLHPTHNFAIVQYDPGHIGETDIRAITMCLKPLKQGDSTRLISYNRYGNPVCINTVVSDSIPIIIPPSTFPCWRSINAEVITLESPLTLDHPSGVLANDDGEVQALWLSYLSCDAEGKDREHLAGLPVKTILPALHRLQQGQEPQLRSLNIEVGPINVAQARKSGLSDRWMQELQQSGRNRGSLFWVKSVETRSNAMGVLNDLDIIITINGKLMTRLEDLDVQYTHDELTMVVLRNKKEMELKVKTTECGQGTDRLVFWAGATLQAPHKAALQQSRKVPSGVYTTARSAGSPAYMYGLMPTMWITHVNGQSTPDLDSFIAAVQACADNTYVRIKTMTFDMVPMVLSIKTCYHYWPTSVLTLDSTAECGWRSDKDDQ